MLMSISRLLTKDWDLSVNWLVQVNIRMQWRPYRTIPWPVAAVDLSVNRIPMVSTSFRIIHIMSVRRKSMRMISIRM